MAEAFTVEYPTGSGVRMRLRDVARDLARRLVSIWLPDETGARPVYGPYPKLRTDPEWRDLLWFHEYFHGDTGAGIGASHQTGWTGLVAHLLCRGGVLDEALAGIERCCRGRRFLSPSLWLRRRLTGLSPGRRPSAAARSAAGDRGRWFPSLANRPGRRWMPSLPKPNV